MRDLLRSETRKVITTRSTWGIMAALAAVVVLGVLQTVTTAEAAKPLWEQQFYFLANMNGRLFLLVLGIKIVTDDFRHGTIVPTLLVTPRRDRVAAAKIVVASATGLVAVALTSTAMMAAALPRMDRSLSGIEVRALIGFVLAGALWTSIGSAIGLIVRHQVGAIVGAIVWVVAVEQMVTARYESLGDYLPAGGSGALAASDDFGGMIVGGLVLVAWATASWIGGGLVLLRRDVP